MIKDCVTLSSDDILAERGTPVRHTRHALLFVLFLLPLTVFTFAQDAAVNPSVPPAPHAKEIHLKHVLVIGETKGFQHDSIPNAMATVFKLGHESGLWDAYLRTDCQLITKKKLEEMPRTSAILTP